jgi:hypothetical protein
VIALAGLVVVPEHANLIDNVDEGVFIMVL